MPERPIKRRVGESEAPSKETRARDRNAAASTESDDSSGPSAAAPRQADIDQHRRFPTHSTSDPAKIREFAIEAARMLQDDKCEEILCLDVRELSQVSDYIVIANGSSDRQMQSAADDVKKLAVQSGYGIFRRSDDDRATWIVLDCVDVVVHIFEPNTRAHYDLEMLWGDAERVKWDRPAGEKPPGAQRKS